MSDPYKLPCPECGEPCEAEFTDIGVGSQQTSPWSCQRCGWVEEAPPDFGPIDEPGDGLGIWRDHL